MRRWVFSSVFQQLFQLQHSARHVEPLHSDSSPKEGLHKGPEWLKAYGFNLFGDEGSGEDCEMQHNQDC